MATHAGADSDVSIVYISLTINDKKKIIKAEKLLDRQRKDMLYKRVSCFIFDRPYVFSELFIVLTDQP